MLCKKTIPILLIFLIQLVTVSDSLAQSWQVKWQSDHVDFGGSDVVGGTLKGDFDGDGTIDILVYNKLGFAVHNGMTGAVQLNVRARSLPGDSYVSGHPLVADIDGDTLDEFVIPIGSTTYAYEVTGGGIGQRPDYPNLHLPTNGASDISNSPVLRWYPAARAEKYWYQIALVPDVNNPLLTAVTTDTFTTVSLSPSTTYYWRVWSENSVGLSEFSSPWWTFTTGTTTDVADNVQNTPPAFALEQNYPNPFNPETTIQYSIKKPGHVSLRVYNGLGKKVRTLLELPTIQPGTYAVTWDGKNDDGYSLASGTYYYQISAGEFLSTQKAIILK